MRVSRKLAEESRARVVAAAARMMRERGIEASSVADMMGAAGMTHGGFYKHFRSKEGLTREAVRFAFDDVVQRFDRRQAESGVEAAVRAYVDEYLSARHLAEPGLGCPVAALGADAGRQSDALGAEFAAGAEKLIARIGAGKATPAARARAIRVLTQLVGTVVAARSVGPGQMREEILAACARDLRKP
jgi:TetR/AcrR family transcriptional repressor of nem operon